MSLRARVLAGVALVAVALVAVAVVVTRMTEANLVGQVDAQLATARASVARFDFERRRAPGLAPPRRPAQQPAPARLSTLYVGYVTPDARVETLFAPNLAGDDAPLPQLDAADAVAGARAGRPFTAGATRSDLRYRVLASADRRGGGVVVLALPLDTVDRAVSRLVAVKIAATAGVLAVLAVVGWWVLHLGVRPVKQMTVIAGSIAEGDLSPRVPDVDPATEAGQLGAALNRMLGQIEAAFDERRRSEDRLRQFVSDASHELRTPVTTVRGYAELYRAGGLRDPAELGEAMRRTEQEAVRMGKLVDDLLLLARLDEGRALAREPVDLGEVVLDAVRDARAVDPQRPVTADVDGPVMVTGDGDRLRQVVANLVANALVHTPPGTAVEVRAGRRDGHAVVEVADHGPGMAPEVAERAFERFYRADPSRSRHRGGNGLGLSIVRATVQAHGGDVSLESRPGAGTTVRVEIPAGVSVPGAADSG